MPILKKPDAVFDKKALELITQTKTAVLSTVTKAGRPQSAAISFLFVAPNEFYMVVGKESAKYKNLLKNPYVALAIFDDSEMPGTVQIEGAAAVVKNEDEERYILDRFTNEVWGDLPFYPVTFRLPNPRLVLVKITVLAGKWFKDEMKVSTLTLYPQTLT